MIGKTENRASEISFTLHPWLGKEKNEKGNCTANFLSELGTHEISSGLVRECE